MFGSLAASILVSVEMFKAIGGVPISVERDRRDLVPERPADRDLYLGSTDESGCMWLIDPYRNGVSVVSV